MNIARVEEVTAIGISIEDATAFALERGIELHGKFLTTPWVRAICPLDPVNGWRVTVACIVPDYSLI
jgi:hypothetical protein